MKETVSKIFFFSIFLLILSFGCTKKVLSPDEYIHWVENEENGLKVKKEIGEFVFELQYKPHAYLAALKNKGKETIKAKDLEDFSGLEHYNLKITSKNSDVEMLRVGAGSEAGYQERINYFSFVAQKDIQLKEGTHIAPCILYHFERSYDLAPFCNLVLGFEEGRDKKDKTDKIISFDDQVLGTGRINMVISSKDIESIPLIKIDP